MALPTGRVWVGRRVWVGLRIWVGRRVSVDLRVSVQAPGVAPPGGTVSAVPSPAAAGVAVVLAVPRRRGVAERAVLVADGAQRSLAEARVAVRSAAVAAGLWVWGVRSVS
ncbi:hypothetical protein, partial [Mycobacterium asiaticum]|uniref:hypothetical protein n=1 Tax=Mycobacterium asiaticum TaxID=1790 RepID=UPI0020A50DB8